MNENAAGRGANRTDLIAGAVMLAICAIFVWRATTFGIGTPARMGAGFFPFAFGLIGMAIAATVMIRSVLAPEPGNGETIRLRPLLFVLLGVIAFGLLIRPAGLGPAIIVSSTITAFADDEAAFLPSLLLSIGLSIGVWFVFVKLLGLPLAYIAGVF